MAIRIGDVWDSTTEVLAGRAGLLAPVAALALFLPAAIQSAITSYGGPSAGTAALAGLVAIVGAVATLWGQLTVVGIASDPDTTAGVAARRALARLPAALLVLLVLLAIALVAVLPIVLALVASGFDFEAAVARTGSAAASPLTPGALLFCVLYGLALLVASLWLSARMFVWSPVVLNERRGIGAIGRSIALTRGLTLKLIGVALLFGIVCAVAATAAKFVLFLIFRLLLGPPHIATATWLGELASAAVTAVFVTVIATFTARLYAALVRGAG